METFCCMSLSGVFAPGETKDLTVEPTVTFRPERLVVAEVLRSAPRLVSAWLGNLPFAITENFLALFSDYPGPGWQLPPYFPMQIVQFSVGPHEQFRDAPRVPAELFASYATDPRLHFDICRIGQKLTLAVQSQAKHTFTFRAGIIGVALKDIA
jgi:hypothetical protein